MAAKPRYVYAGFKPGEALSLWLVGGPPRAVNGMWRTLRNGIAVQQSRGVLVLRNAAPLVIVANGNKPLRFEQMVEAKFEAAPVTYRSVNHGR